MSEITKHKDRGSLDKWKIAWWAFFAFVVFVYLFGLTIPLLGPDEPRYAQVAREMLDRGDWITPTLGGFTWFEKPALLYWLEMIAFKLFGVSEFAARLGPALFGLGTVLSLGWLGSFFSKEREAKSPDAGSDLGKWVALIAASTLGIIVFARGASFDIIVTFPITASLVGFYFFDQRRSESFAAKYIPLALFYFFIGVALIGKGLIGVVFPGAIVSLYFLISRRLPDRAFVFSTVWGTLLFVAVAAVWYLPMYEINGYKFIDEFIIQHHFQRFTSNKYQHPQPFYFYLWILPLMTIPWVPFFLAAVMSGIRDGYRQLRDHRSEHLQPIVLFAWAWLIVPLGFFSISGSKLPGYIMPSVPAAVLLTAIYLKRFLERGSKWRIAIFSMGVGTLAVCVVLLVTVVPQFANGDSVKGLVAEADSKGYVGEKVLNFHSISHNAEFYAAGRLVRDATGKQREYWVTPDLRRDIASLGGKPVLVLVRLEHIQLLKSDQAIDVEVIGDNGETAITRVSLRNAN